MIGVNPSPFCCVGQNLNPRPKRTWFTDQILEALARHERERQQLRMELAAVERERGLTPISPDDVKKQTRAFLAEWDGLVTSNGAEARPLLDWVLEKRKR